MSRQRYCRQQWEPGPRYLPGPIDEATKHGRLSVTNEQVRGSLSRADYRRAELHLGCRRAHFLRELQVDVAVAVDCRQNCERGADIFVLHHLIANRGVSRKRPKNLDKRTLRADENFRLLVILREQDWPRENANIAA